MFSKEESARMREEFWTSFGQSYSQKWILYRTKRKDISFKFYFDTKKAMVLFDLECEPVSRAIYFEKLEQLRSILLEEYLPDVLYEQHCFLSTGKEISRLSVTMEGVSIHNRNTWQVTMAFFAEKMQAFEMFWHEYQDFIFDT